MQVIYTEYFIGSADWKTDLGGGGESSIVSQQPILKTNALYHLLPVSNTDKINTGL